MKPRTGLLVTVLVVGALGVGLAVLAGPVTAQSGTVIDSCQTIDQPGEYVLEENLTGLDGFPCIEILASDVTIDGQGNTLAGTGRGIEVGNASNTDLGIDGIEVTNIVLENWDRGAVSNNQGSEFALRDVVVRNVGGDGVRIEGTSGEVQVVENVTIENVQNSSIGTVGHGIDVGYTFEAAQITNVSASNVAGAELSGGQGAGADVTRYEFGNTLASTDGLEIVNLNEETDPPDVPATVGEVGVYLSAEPTFTDGSMDTLRLFYDDAGTSGRVDIWQYESGSGWEPLDGTTGQNDAGAFVEATNLAIASDSEYVFGVFDGNPQGEIAFQEPVTDDQQGVTVEYTFADSGGNASVVVENADTGGSFSETVTANGTTTVPVGDIGGISAGDELSAELYSSDAQDIRLDDNTTQVQPGSGDVSDCRVIDESGGYQLVQDIQSDGTCVEITAGDVVLDGNGYNVTGSPEVDPGSAGILVNGTGVGGIGNVTVENVVTTDWSNGIRLSDADDGVVRNVTVRSVTENGIRIDSDSDRNRIVESESTDNEFAGLALFSSDDNTIANNTFDSNNALSFTDNAYVEGSNGNVFRNNSFDDAGRDGVLLTGDSANNEFRNNSLNDNVEWGILANSGSSGNVIVNNTASRNGIDGIQLFDEANNTVVAGNEVRNNSFRGIVLSGASSGTVVGNATVTNNTVVDSSEDGINLDGAVGSVVADNEVRSNGGDGIKLTDDFSTVASENNRIRNNTVRNNSDEGIELEGGIGNDLLDNVVERNDDDGISLTESPNGVESTGNEVRNGTVRSNAGVAFRILDGATPTVANVDIGASTAANTTVSFDARNVTLGSVANPPTDPADRENVSRYVNATSTGDGELRNLELAYDDADLGGVDETTLALYRFNGTAGEWQALTDTGVDTDRNVVTGNVTEFSTFGAFAQEPALFNVTITGTNDPVTEGDTLSVTANVTNTGDVTATQTVTLTDTGFDDTQRDAVDVTLAGGESNESVVLEWATAEGDAGTGTVTVATGNDTDSQEVTVQQPGIFAVNVTATTSPVVEGDILSVTANVTNTGDVETTQTVTLADTGFDGIQRDAVDVTLAGGESNESVELEWATAEGDAGTGDVTVASEDNADSQQVTVQGPAAFVVTITDTNDPVTEGDAVSVTANVTNTGDVETTQTITLTDTGFDGIQRDAVDVTLAGGESNESVVLEWTTSPGDAGTGDVTVASDDDSDAASVTVQEPGAFAVEIVGTNAPVTPGETLSVTATVTNTGDVEATQTVTLSDTGFTGAQQDATDLTLAGGATESVTLTWVPGEDDTGAGGVTVATDDDSDAASVTVQEPAAFELDVAVPGEPVLRSETMTVEATATNIGGVAGSATMTVSVNGTEVETTDVALQAGASETMTVEWDTSDVTLPVETDDWNRGRGSDREDAKDVDIDVVVSMGDEVATTTATVECLDPGELSRDDPHAALCDDDHDGRDDGSADGDDERERVSPRVARNAP